MQADPSGYGQGGPAITTTQVTIPAGGTVNFTVTAPANFTQMSLTATATGLTAGGQGTSEFARNVQVQVRPQANNDNYATNSDQTLTVPAGGVLLNDTNPDGGSLSAAAVTYPTAGTLVFNSNGSFTYTPTASGSFTDSFTYDDLNGEGLTSNIATVTINVGSSIIAQPDSYTVIAGQTLQAAALES